MRLFLRKQPNTKAVEPGIGSEHLEVGQAPSCVGEKRRLHQLHRLDQLIWMSNRLELCYKGKNLWEAICILCTTSVLMLKWFLSFISAFSWCTGLSGLLHLYLFSRLVSIQVIVR
jgi:hypothetical protein